MRVIELSDAVGAEHRSRDALIRRIDNRQMRETVVGDRTVKDILGHIAAVDSLQRVALAAAVGRGAEQPMGPHEYPGWIAEQYARRANRTLDDIAAEVRENGARYLSLIKSLHDEDLAKQIQYPWGGEGTVHRMILDGLNHVRRHREELEATLAHT